MEYLYTNLPRYITVTPRSAFANSVVQSGSVRLFSEDGTTLTAKLPDGSFITVGGSGGTDVSPTTAEAGDVLSGKIFFTSGGVQTSGTIPTVSASLAANVTTVPAGYIAAAQTLIVPLASSATVSGGIVTIPAGYVASDYTVSAGGGSATDFFRCTLVTSGGSTWTGNKAVLSGGKYSYESAVTSGLSYGSGFTPEVGKVYADGALIQANLYDGIPKDGLVFYAPLSSAAQTAETGQGLLTIGNATYQTVSGVPCCNSTVDDGVAVDELMVDLDPGVPKTVSCWVYITEWPASSSLPFIIMTLQNGGGTAFQIYSDHTIRADRWSPSTAVSGNYATCIAENMSLNTWYNIVAVDDGSTWKLFINGVQTDSKNVGEYRKTTDNLNAAITCAGTSAEDFGPYNLRGYMASARIYNRALSADEVFALSKEFTPTVS